MSGWQDVLDVQLDLIRMWRSQMGQRAASAFGANMERVEIEELNPYSEQLVRRIDQYEVSGLMTADPFYVDDEMMTLIAAASETFQPEPLQAFDLPAAAAFVVLPQPVATTDRHGDLVAFRAMLWRPARLQVQESGETEDGILLSLYSNVYDDDDYTRVYEYAAQHGEWPPGHRWREEAELIPKGEGFAPTDPASIKPGWRDDIVAASGTPFMLVHTTPWMFGTDLPTTDMFKKASWWPAVQAFMRLSMQTIATRTVERPPRAAAKRWKRAGHEDRYITVVRLRRPRHPAKEGEQGTVEWSHRWIVTGHWRNQWYPSLGMHRQRWIGAHVKGPEGKELLVRRGRAFELVK